MAEEREIIFLNRDTYAMLVPSGARVMLNEGTEVVVTQALGNSFTVNVYGNLARIDAKDADALGKEVHNPIDDLPSSATLEDKVWAQMHAVYDPEIPVNVVDLGLIYACNIEAATQGKFLVRVTMTLTAPGCGMGPVIADDVKQKIEQIPEIEAAEIEFVFDPPWDQSMMSDVAKLELGLL